MDSKDNFLVEISKFLSGVDKDYLVAMSNKGIYKRALKDMENGLEVKIGIEGVKDGFIKTILSDGSECSITLDIKNLKCSCPSRTVCKHIIISLIYVKNNLKKLLGEEIEIQEELQGDFSEVLNLDIKKIQKALGEKAFKEIIYRIQYGVKVNIEEGKLLNIDFEAEQIKVKFPERDSVNQSICSCKNDKLCIHRAEAILHYKLFKGQISIDDIVESSIEKFNVEILGNIQKIIEDIMSVGISRVPINICERLEHIALLCQSSGLHNLQKLLRTAIEEFNRYFSKNANFIRQQLLDSCTKIYNVCDAMQNLEPSDVRQLIGEARSVYFKIPPEELHCIAAESWVTKSGYEGLTIYFWNDNRKEWFTYTKAQANYYENSKFDARAEYNANFKDMQGKVLKFYNLSINNNRRISSSVDVKTEFLDKEHILKKGLLECRNWKVIKYRLLKNCEEIFFKEDENYNIFVLRAKKCEKATYDEVKQVLEVPILDEEDRILILTVKYSSGNKRMIETLEKLLDVERFFVKAYVENGVLRAFPVSMFYEGRGVFNFTVNYTIN